MQRDNEGPFFSLQRFLLKDNTSFLTESGNKVNSSWTKNKYTLQFAAATGGAEAPSAPLEGRALIVGHFSRRTPQFV